MKKITYILLSFIVLALISCEDVIDLDLKTSKERLVIEALIKWEKETTGNEQDIKLSKTSSYYTNQNIPATGASVTITHQNGTQYVFSEISDGTYRTTTFQPEIDASYTLQITHGGETFTAVEKLISVPEIDMITQVDVPNGSSSIIPNVEVFFIDEANIENFYKITYKRTRGAEVVDEQFNLYDDQFEDGNQLSNIYLNHEILPNDIFEISLFGISERFYNYLELIEIQSNADGFGPFSTPPVNVKGNCVNTTDNSNYPYGYFGLSEVAKETYIFQ